jgi:hypothetical protein
MASNNTGNLPHQRGDRLTYRDRNWSETTGRDNQIPAKRVSTMLGNVAGGTSSVRLRFLNWDCTMKDETASARPNLLRRYRAMFRQ